jgi:hypothetical protein
MPEKSPLRGFVRQAYRAITELGLTDILITSF